MQMNRSKAGFTLVDRSAQRGFTLIELSIVLVIIGLIVGGVLVGQDLIKGAEIRSAVSQFEKYDAAANAFRGKYGGLPGDVKNPANYGFTDNFDTAPNGNGRIERATDDGTNFNNEAAAFFRHLFQANLINDNITITDFTAGTSDTITQAAPISKVAGAAYIFVTAVSGLNYYTIARGATWDGADITFATSGELRVIDAFQLDTKMDDGNASNGRVRAVTNFNTADSGTQCHSSGTYNTSASANDTTCTIRLRTSF